MPKVNEYKQQIDRRLEDHGHAEEICNELYETIEFKRAGTSLDDEIGVARCRLIVANPTVVIKRDKAVHGTAGEDDNQCRAAIDCTDLEK